MLIEFCNLISKQTIVSFTPFCCWGEQIQKNVGLGGMNNFFLPEVRNNDKTLVESYDWGAGHAEKCLDSMDFLEMRIP